MKLRFKNHNYNASLQTKQKLQNPEKQRVSKRTWCFMAVLLWLTSETLSFKTENKSFTSLGPENNITHFWDQPKYSESIISHRIQKKRNTSVAKLTFRKHHKRLLCVLVRTIRTERTRQCPKISLSLETTACLSTREPLESIT